MYKADFEYNANAHRQSMKMFETNDPSAANPAYNLSYTRYYAGEYEKQVSENNTTEVCYINTPVGLAAAHVTQNNTPEIFYLHTDHLGSIIGVSNSNQQKIYEVSYDAWGKKRAVEFWFPTNEPQTPPNWLWRGYTGHEHLTVFNLIDMKGRFYDPQIGQMLSPDPLISEIENAQTYNKYSYVFNNPFKYTDPTGYYGGALGPGDISMEEERELREREQRELAEFEKSLREEGINIGKEIVIDGNEEENTPNYTDRVGLLDYIGYISDLVGTAAGLTVHTTHKYGQMINGVVKSAAQLTKENAKVWSKVATRVNIAGGMIGLVDSGLQSYDDFSKGNYGLGTYEASKGTAYLVGLGLCTNPVTLGAGLTVLGVTGLIDIAGDIGLYIYGRNQ